jgi:hypothetical protein
MADRWQLDVKRGSRKIAKMFRSAKMLMIINVVSDNAHEPDKK